METIVKIIDLELARPTRDLGLDQLVLEKLKRSGAPIKGNYHLSVDDRYKVSLEYDKELAVGIYTFTRIKTPTLNILKDISINVAYYGMIVLWVSAVIWGFYQIFKGN